MLTSKAEPELPIEPPQLLGGPSFDHDTYFQGIEQARALLVQAVQTYWEKLTRADAMYRRIKPAAIALFREENGPHADPYDIVARNPPPAYKRGTRVLAYEFVPAWTMYIERADLLLRVVETAR